MNDMQGIQMRTAIDTREGLAKYVYQGARSILSQRGAIPDMFMGIDPQGILYIVETGEDLRKNEQSKLKSVETFQDIVMKSLCHLASLSYYSDSHYCIITQDMVSIDLHVASVDEEKRTLGSLEKFTNIQNDYFPERHPMDLFKNRKTIHSKKDSDWYKINDKKV